jgi:VanZ family protein
MHAGNSDRPIRILQCSGSSSDARRAPRPRALSTVIGLAYPRAAAADRRSIRASDFAALGERAVPRFCTPMLDRTQTMEFTLSRPAWRRIAWLGAIALGILSLIPTPELLAVDVADVDKLYHTTAYAALMWWFALGYRRERWRIIAPALACYGVALELAQGMTPDRTMSSFDAAANVTGILLGYWIARVTPAGFPAFRRAE